MAGPRSLTHIIPKAAKKNVSKRFPRYESIFLHWKDIVGDEFASKCVPSKTRMRFEKIPKSDKKKFVGLTLYLSTTNSWKTELEYNGERIKERINLFLGESLVEKVMYISDADAESFLKTPCDITPPKLLPQEQEELDTALANITDDSLREKLAHFGQTLITRT